MCLSLNILQVDLPELKNVDEYSTNFGKAERQKRYTTPLKIEDYLPKKLPTTSTASKSKSTKSHKQNVKYDDESHLLSDDDDEDQDNYDVLKSMTNKVLNSIELANLFHYKILSRAIQIISDTLFHLSDFHPLLTFKIRFVKALN